MASLTLNGDVRKVLVHIQEGRARDMALEVELAASLRVALLPPAVDELVAHRAIVTTAATGGVYGETPRRLT
jgi:hypothetical protein